MYILLGLCQRAAHGKIIDELTVRLFFICGLLELFASTEDMLHSDYVEMRYKCDRAASRGGTACPHHDMTYSSLV